ncbi:molybdopterin-dependent oxidoreductase [Nonomuraea sp. NPDC050790]|uniref:molybdopterin-dependent oxidoreductase n=1 Tax=Nonomuraea sp. NPDC050790 TaxID=3364371 RepID=UPI003798EFCF
MSGRERGVSRAGLAGLAGLTAALAVGDALALLVRPAASPVLLAGSLLIDLAPEPAKEFAIRTFGENDKAALILAVIAVLVPVAFLLGVVAVHRRLPACLAAGGLGVVTAVIGATRAAAQPLDALPSLAAGLIGALFLAMLGSRRAGAVPAAGPDRRRVLVAGLGVGAGAVLADVALRLGLPEPEAAPAIPRPGSPARPLPPGADLKLPGLSPFTTPNDRFYRVDTALVIPRVDAQAWRLRIHGTRTIELGFDELLRLGLIERDITLTCVSNEVGGPYAGNARWVGVPLAALLARAGVPAGTDQLLSRSHDGWTGGTPLAAVLDGRDAMLAVAMNGTPLPPAHGFPARLVVPGLYGFVSATKWVTDLRLTRYTDERAYWTRRGWATDAPVKTMSRIELPAPFARLRAGAVQVAGVAWAQRRGIAAVEVRADGGAWHPVRLAAVPGADTWRQWSWTWQAAPGTHRLEVRATDAAGRTQTEKRANPFPSGADGWHSVVVTVT